MTTQQQDEKTGDTSRAVELMACTSCGGYHYLNRCIYSLSWFDWLEYHAKYMSSQPYNIPFGIVAIDDIEDLEKLQQRARILDETVYHRPNYLSNTKLKEDLMTTSNIGAFWDEEEWRLKLQHGSRYQTRKQKLLRVQHTKMHGEEESGWPVSGDEDEEVLDSVRVSFGKHLPRTSFATLFPPEQHGGSCCVSSIS